jgi:hypothetical protein
LGGGGGGGGVKWMIEWRCWWWVIKGNPEDKKTRVWV